MLFHFYWNSELVILQGLCLAKLAHAQFHHFRRLTSTYAIAELYILEVQSVKEEDSVLQLPEHLEPELALLFRTYHMVFDKPVGLPPEKPHNHAIRFIERAKPIKLRPYRQPHSLKE